MTMHAYNRERSYLITETRTVHFSIDKGSTWHKFEAPADPNGLGIPVLDFHPINPDWLIWTGQIDCGETDSQTCRAVAYFTKDNGRSWSKIDEYVRVCSWGRDKNHLLRELPRQEGVPARRLPEQQPAPARRRRVLLLAEKGPL
jgi:hypothetical protein